MYSSKLIQVLRAFTKEEFRNLNKFLNAPRYRDGSRKHDPGLFKSIAPYYPFQEKSKIEKARIFKKIYPTEVYKPGKLEKQMSSLFSLVQDFIITRNSDNREELHQLLTLAAFYRTRSLHSLAEICIKKYKRTLAQTDQRDANYFYDIFLLEKQVANHQATFQDSKKALNFPQALEHLDQYYIFEKLELACRMLAIHRFLFPVDLKNSLVVLDHLLPLLDADFFATPVINVYYKAYRFLNGKEEDSETRFLIFEEALNDCKDLLSDNQLLSLNSIIRNHCIGQYHKGTAGYLKKSFYVYQDHLEKGYLYYEDKLYAATMMNMVVSGLRLNQVEWVFKFIKDHQDRITGTNSPEEVYRLNLANYYFYVKNYNKALDYLVDTYENIYYKLIAKRLEIKIYFEMKHVLLAPRIDAFKIYVYRFTTEKITQKHKVGNRNFIDLLKQIQLPRTFQNEKRIDKLMTKVKQSKYIPEKEWLLEKLEKLR